jgi:spore maturation protein CgeB
MLISAGRLARVMGSAKIEGPVGKANERFGWPGSISYSSYRMSNMRIMILSTDYPQFLGSLYGARPGLAEASYSEQAKVRQESLFGFSDYYSRNFRAHGHEANEIRVNNPWMQHAWAREAGFTVAPPATQAAPTRGTASRLVRKLLRPVVRPFRSPAGSVQISAWEAEILRAQIDDFRPDVILNQEPHHISSRFMQGLRVPGRIIAGQIASAIPVGENFHGYDVVFSSLPNIVDFVRKRGIRGEMVRLGFEPSILDALGPQPARDIELSFVGGLSPEHVGRIQFLEHIARHAPLKLWGLGIERIEKSSPLHACYQGQAWGREMYNILRRSRVTLNFHIDLSEGWANNMRLYEATGMGAALLTDAKKNLHEMFEPGREVATYVTAQDCVDQANFLLSDETQRAALGDAGQKRVIESHGYYRRTGELIEIFKTF